MCRFTEEYEVHSFLSPCLFGDILFCQARGDQRNMAAKVIDVNAALSQYSKPVHQRVGEDVYMERQVNRILSADSKYPMSNILTMHSDFEEDGKLVMVFDYCAKGDLFAKINDGNVSAAQVRRYFSEIVHGVKNLHSRGFSHRDLSLENILLDDNDHCLLFDFGLAVPHNSKYNNAVGKEFYMAPEVYRRETYDPSVADMWSLGVILVILLTGSPPFRVPCTRSPHYNLVLEQGIAGLFKAWEEEVSPSAVDLLSHLLVPAKERYTLKQVLGHPFVRSPSFSRRLSKFFKKWTKKEKSF